MRATIEWAEQKYDEMNRLLFNNYLPPCDFSTDLTGAKTLGRFCLTRYGVFVNRKTGRLFVKDNWDNVLINRGNIYDLACPKIKFNNNYDATEEALLATLVHEMCHYYTYCEGYCPKQGHGPEFRAIAYTVGVRSNGRFTIQRFASAEEMAQRTLDPELQAKKDRRTQNKKANTNALIIYLANGEVRLITTTNPLLIDTILYEHKKKEKEKQIIKAISTNDADFIEFLYKMGYNKTMRTYRYWSVENKPWIKDIENQYNFETLVNNRLMENKDNNIVMIDPNMDLSERSPLEGMEGNSLRITEEDITDMVCETVKRVIKEISLEKSRAAFKASGEKLDNMSYRDPNYEKAHRQYKNLYTHFKDRAGENYDPNMPVIICTTQGVENLTAGELEKHYTITGYVEPSQNHIYANQKMIGYPHLKGLIGPMWDGDRLRYEDEETYHWLSI